MAWTAAFSTLLFFATSCKTPGRIRLGTEAAQQPRGHSRLPRLKVQDLKASDQLAIGERYLELGYNFRAKREFMRVIERFPGASETAVAQFKIGLCYLREEMYKEALEQFRLFVSNFPSHRLADSARRRIRLLELKLEQPKPQGPDAGLIADLEGKLKRARKALSDARNRAASLAREVRALESERQGLKERLSKRVTELEAALKSAKESLRDKEQRIADLEAARSAAVSGMDAGMKALERSLREEKERVVDLQKRLKDAGAKLEEAEVKAAGLDEMLRTKVQELEQARQRIQELKSEIERAGADRKESKVSKGIVVLKKRIASLEAELEAAKSRAGSAEARAAQLEKKLALKFESEKKLKSMLNDLEKVAADRAGELDRARRDLEAARAEAASLRKRLETKKDELSKSGVQASRLEKERRKAQDRVRELESVVEKLESANKDLKAEAARLQSKIAALEKTPSCPKPVEVDGHVALPSLVKSIAVQVLTLPCRTKQEVEHTFADFAEAGVDTVIFRVFHNQGDRFYGFGKPLAREGVYFRTQRAPVVFDALSVAVKAAKKAGLKIWAWMTTRYATYGLKMDNGWQTERYDFASGRIVPAKGLNLFSPLVRDHLAGLFRDLADYEIDGILFQDDLVLRHTEGWSDVARDLFKLDTGTELSPADLYHGVFMSDDGRYYVSRYSERFWDWSAWKNEKILELAKSLVLAARGRRPGLKFGINLMYEAVTSPKNALAWLSQSMVQARKAGFDLLSVMAYHRQIERELNLEGRELEHLMEKLAKKAAEMAGDPGRVMVKLQVKDWKTGKRIPVSELEKMLSRVLKTRGISIAFVPVGTIEDLKILEASGLSKRGSKAASIQGEAVWKGR